MNRKKIALISAIALGTIAAGVCSFQAVASTFYMRTNFFSGPDHTSYAGQATTYCNGVHTFYGQQTPYFTKESYDCSELN